VYSFLIHIIFAPSCAAHDDHVSEDTSSSFKKYIFVTVTVILADQRSAHTFTCFTTSFFFDYQMYQFVLCCSLDVVIHFFHKNDRAYSEKDGGAFDNRGRGRIERWHSNI